MQIAHVGAEIAFQSPERGDHGGRHAIFLFRARKRRGIGLDLRLALLHPERRCHAAGELGECLAEHALAAVTVDDALVVDEVRRGFGHRALRHAGGDRLLFQVGKEAVEIHAVVQDAARGLGAAATGCSPGTASGLTGAGAAGLAGAGRTGAGAGWADAAEESTRTPQSCDNRLNSG